MLSRTADNLFWMCRYLERAENTARMLEVNLQMSLLPQDEKTRENLWRAMLRISELQAPFDEAHPDATLQDVLHYMVSDPENTSSIYSCLHAARENARAVRGSLTTELWETHNLTWLELLRHLREGLPERDPSRFFEWVKFRSQVARGVTLGTVLDDEALCFQRLGANLERADNTARLLDVKFHEREDVPELVLPPPPGTPAVRSVSAHAEYYRWTAILGSVSALEIYRRVYRDIVSPDRVAELLILRGDMPRSLLACVNAVSTDLIRIRNHRSAETERLAGVLAAELRYGRIETILKGGLHVYLEHFLRRIYDLGNGISEDFLVPLSS